MARFGRSFPLRFLPSRATAQIVLTPATTVTFSGPSNGTVLVASTPFTVSADGVITGTVIVTPDDGGDGGTFAPTTANITQAARSNTFTYTPATTGSKSINITNNGGLSNQGPISYTSNAAFTSGVAAQIVRFASNGINFFGLKR